MTRIQARLKELGEQMDHHVKQVHGVMGRMQELRELLREVYGVQEEP